MELVYFSSSSTHRQKGTVMSFDDGKKWKTKTFQMSRAAFTYLRFSLKTGQRSRELSINFLEPFAQTLRSVIPTTRYYSGTNLWRKFHSFLRIRSRNLRRGLTDDWNWRVNRCLWAIGVLQILLPKNSYISWMVRMRGYEREFTAIHSKLSIVHSKTTSFWKAAPKAILFHWVFLNKKESRNNFGGFIYCPIRLADRAFHSYRAPLDTCIIPFFDVDPVSTISEGFKNSLFGDFWPTWKRLQLLLFAFGLDEFLLGTVFRPNAASIAQTNCLLLRARLP